MSLGMPFGALLKRELLTSLRRTRTFFLLAAVTALSGGWFLYSMIGFGVAGMQASALLSLFTTCLYVVTFAIVPPLAAVSVCEEKQRETFDLLATSLIRPSGVVIGKLLNALGVYALIIVALLPIVGVLFFFVGVDMREFTERMLRVCTAAFFCGAVGLLCSVRSRTPLRAILLSYGVLVGFWLLPGGSSMMVMLFLDTQYAGIFLQLLPTQLVACLLLLWATRILRKPPKPASVSSQRPIDDPEQLRLRRRTFPYYLADPLKRKPAIQDHQSAIYRREIQTSPYSQATFRIRTGYLFFLLTLPVTVPVFFGSVGVPKFVAMVNMLLICVLAPAMASTLMVREYEQENADMLRMTLVQPVELLFGKLLAGMSFLLPMIFGSFPLVCLAFLVGGRGSGLASLVGVYLSLINTLVQVVILSLVATLACRRTATALVAAYATSGFFLVLLPLGLLSAGGYLESSRDYNMARGILGLYPSPLLYGWFSEGGVGLLNQAFTAVSSAALFWGGLRYYERKLLRDR